MAVQMNALVQNCGIGTTQGYGLVNEAKPPSPLETATSRVEENLAILRKRVIELEQVLQPLLLDPLPCDPNKLTEPEPPSSPHVGWMKMHAREIASVQTQIESLIARLQS